MERGHTKYTSNWGLVEPRKEICAYMERKCSLKYNPEDEVLVTVGDSEAIDAAIMAIVQNGDEVITAFGKGGEGYIRASYCYFVEHITEALKKIAEFVK